MYAIRSYYGGNRQSLLILEEQLLLLIYRKNFLITLTEVEVGLTLSRKPTTGQRKWFLFLRTTVKPEILLLV